MDTKKLRQKILDLAIRGKLVPQDPNDEPASVLLQRIREEKERLIKEGKIKRSKTSAANNDIEPPFEIPESWEWTTIGEICFSIFAGGDKPEVLSTSQTEKCCFPVFANAVQNDGLYGYTDHSVVTNPAITVSARGTIGFVCKRNTPFTPIVRLVTAIPPESIIDYLTYTLSCLTQPTEGSSIPQLTVPTFKNILIPLPPIKEQIRIVKTIENLFSIINEIESNKQSLNSHIDKAKSKILDLAIHGKLVPQDPNDEPASVLLERIREEKKRLVKEGKLKKKDLEETPISENEIPFEIPESWEWCRLNALCTFLSRGKSPSYSDVPNNYPVFAQKCNLKDGGISLEQARFLKPETVSKWQEEYHLRTDDVLVNSTGTGTVCRTRLFNENCLGEYPFTVPDSHVSVVRTSDNIFSAYICFLFNSKLYQDYWEDRLAGSTNQKELYIGVLQNTIIPLPPLAEQKRIVAKIEELFAVLDSISAS